MIENMTEIQQIIVALDMYEEMDSIDREIYIDAMNERYGTDKYPFIMEEDIENVRGMLEKALKQLQNLDINIVKEEELSQNG